MRANGNTVRHRQCNGAFHRVLITSMKAAGDVGAADVGHQQRIIRNALAHIAVEVYKHLKNLNIQMVLDFQIVLNFQ